MIGCPACPAYEVAAAWWCAATADAAAAAAAKFMRWWWWCCEAIRGGGGIDGDSGVDDDSDVGVGCMDAIVVIVRVGNSIMGAVVTTGDMTGVSPPPPVTLLAAVATLPADLFLFQQSGWIFLVSSAMTLARCEKWSRSVCGRDFHDSPSSTLMALQCASVLLE